MPSVLDGRKTMTRRAEPCLSKFNDSYSRHWVNGRFVIIPTGEIRLFDIEGKLIEIVCKSRYKVGEVVAITQPYKDIIRAGVDMSEAEVRLLKDMPGWNNKLFVRADLMPHQIRITDIKVERMQDISDEDCIKEGVLYNESALYKYAFSSRELGWFGFTTPQDAFQCILKKCCKPKTLWDDNPWVFAYSYELVK